MENNDNSSIEGRRTRTADGGVVTPAPPIILYKGDYLRARHMLDLPEGSDPDTPVGIIVDDGHKAGNEVQIMVPGVSIPPILINVTLAAGVTYRPPERIIPEREKWPVITGRPISCYEWECPNCGTMNITYQDEGRVDCDECLETYYVGRIDKPELPHLRCPCLDDYYD